ncbi:MAG: glycoside hydrolase family 3 C-terminal domain-containing protein [Clostridia bacterium]|nr:glycoside hydrolase family 3 C-terminal domain-containing protein [Clostridia bacterium]
MANVREKYKKEFEDRARALVSQMTLEEKVSQMINKTPEIEHLGIKEYDWWNEALHGVARAGVATVFPQAIALGATFDTTLVERIADVISTEARAKYNASQRVKDYKGYKGLTFWSPNVNIFRDPRWGRGHETYGEDPYLTARVGVAFINGLQGYDEKYLKSAGCAKHFAVHSGPEGIRSSFNAKVGQRDLWETYLPAFEACVKEAQVEGVMGAYNRTNDEPCCGSPTLLKGILRDKWGFDGYVTSDCGAIAYFHDYHKVTNEPVESVKLAVENTCDLNCGCMYQHAVNAVKSGLLDEKYVDECLVRLFTTRMKLGEFDESTPWDNIPYSVVACPEHRALALESAKKSIVLLKNNGALPLDKKKIKSIGVIGPNANNRVALQGNYHGTATRYVTVLEGIQDFCEKEGIRVYFSDGCDLIRPSVEWYENDRLDEVREICRECDVVIGVFGLDETLEGEEMAGGLGMQGDKPDLKFPGIQNQIMKEISSNAKKSILVSLTGSAMDLSQQDKDYDAIIQGWYPGEKGGEAIAKAIFGEYSFEGKLPITFYKSTEDVPNFLDYSMKGRTYRYIETEPLYPFGYGLSYNDYVVEAKLEGNMENGFEIDATVENKGAYDGSEVVQVYIKALRENAPNFSLKAFERVELKAREKKAVKIRLNSEAFALYNEAGKLELTKGVYEVYVGNRQPDSRTSQLLPTEIKKFTIEI